MIKDAVSESAKKELGVMMSAVQEVVETAVRAF